MAEPLVTLDFNEALELTKRAIAEKGEDYVYEAPLPKFCVNFDADTGAPSCIVGHVLYYKGLTLSDLVHRENQFNQNALQEASRADYNSVGIVSLESDGVVKLTLKALHFLKRLQEHQDVGVSWGASLSEALNEVAYYRFADEH